MTTLAPLEQVAVDKALADFAAAVRAAYGQRLVGVYLFGSRACGDHGPDSDADVAVVIRDERLDRRHETRRLIDLAADPSIESGLFIEPWPFIHVGWSSEATPMIASATRDTRAVGAAA